MTGRKLSPRVRSGLVRALPVLPALALLLVAGLFTRAGPLDLRLNYWRHESDRLEMDPRNPRLLLGLLSREDQANLRAITHWSEWGCDPALATIVATDFADPQDRRKWRSLHACLIRRLAEAGAKVVALDFVFPGEENIAFLKEAVETARSKSVPVILGQDPDFAVESSLYSSSNVRPAILLGLRDPWMKTLKALPLTGRPGIGAPALPNLFLQIYGIDQKIAVDADGAVVAPMLSGKERLWIRYEKAPLVPESYSTLLEFPGRAKDRAVLLGVEGDWAKTDLWTLPIVNPRQAPLATEREEYGVLVQGYAYDQLMASVRDGSAIPGEATGLGRWLLVLLAFVVGVAPALVLSRWFAGSAELFQQADMKPGWLQRLRVWPWPPLLGAGVPVALVAATWHMPYVYPVASVLLAALLGAATGSLPFWLTHRAARRLTRALREVDRARRGRFGDDEIVRLPRGGLGAFQTLLAGPVSDGAALGELVRWLCFALVEAEAARTFFQRLPRRFFADRGWLEAGAAAPATLDKPIERADQLTEAFIGTRLRRVRNDSVHAGLKLNAVELARKALAASGLGTSRLTRNACLRVQLQTLDDCTAYLTDLAGWLRRPPDAGTS